VTKSGYSPLEFSAALLYFLSINRMGVSMNKRTLLAASVALSCLLQPEAVQAGFEWKPAPQARPAPAQGTPANSVSVMPDSVTSGPLMPMPGDAPIPMTVEPLRESDIGDTAPPIAPVTKKSSAGGMQSIGVARPGAPAPTAPVPSPAPTPVTASETDLVMPPKGEMAPKTRNAAPLQPVATMPEKTIPVPAMAAQPAPIKAAASSNGIVQGFGKNIPLAFALRQVVPHEYNFTFAPGVEEGKPVSWSGGSDWQTVMGRMLSDNGLEARIQGETIAIGAKPVAMPKEGSAVAPADTARLSDRPTGPGKVDLQAIRNWSMPKGTSLKSGLSDWAKNAQVDLVWKNQKDFPVSEKIDVEASFAQAVEQALKPLAKTAGGPRATLYPNLPDGPSVLVIE
jgi:hypothetical protein